MSAAVALPTHKLYESPNTRSIDINGWLITAETNPISNGPQCDALQASLGIPLPEMIFGNNTLTLEHKPSGWKYVFSAEEALKGVKRSELEPGDGGVRVDYADAWLKSRTGPSPLLPMPETVPTKPYDWTYTTVYPGAPPADSNFSPVWCETEDKEIPMSELMRPDPIMFYAEIPLFEDELHDNGSSGLIVRIRVMPTCIFILLRFTLRVDNVLFRTHDTRIYHSYESTPPTIIRELAGWEAPYRTVKERLPKRDDMSPLTDPTFISKILADFPKHLSQEQGADTGWRGLGKRVEYIELQ